jgi:hypothetical protein
MVFSWVAGVGRVAMQARPIRHTAGCIALAGTRQLRRKGHLGLPAPVRGRALCGR